MKKTIIYAVSALLLAACDEGRIYPNENGFEDIGSEVRLEAAVSGFDSWPEGYTLSLAGFADGEDYAVISKNITVTSSGENTETVLSNIPAEATRVEVCVLDRLRRRVATFGSIDITSGERSHRLNLGEIDMSMDAALQNEIFSTTCANCHGGSGFAAAGLHLTPGLSRPEMFGVESVKIPGRMRIAPGNPDESLLYEILTTDLSSGWQYDHSREIYDPEKLDLIRSWIISR